MKHLNRYMQSLFWLFILLYNYFIYLRLKESFRIFIKFGYFLNLVYLIWVYLSVNKQQLYLNCMWKMFGHMPITLLIRPRTNKLKSLSMLIAFAFLIYVLFFTDPKSHINSISSWITGHSKIYNNTSKSHLGRADFVRYSIER